MGPPAGRDSLVLMIIVLFFVGGFTLTARQPREERDWGHTKRAAARLAADETSSGWSVGGLDLASLLGKPASPQADWADSAPTRRAVEAARALWGQVEGALTASGATERIEASVRHYPGRGPDFVEEGVRLSRDKMQKARRTWKRFLDLAPAYPGESTFSGRGIVMSGGGLQYTVPAWASINLLRRRGCMLPVEVWFFDSELPPAPMRAAFAGLDATCRSVEAVMGRATPLLFLANSVKPYPVKALALLFSRFRDVLFMDADNVALRDPSFLFDDAPFLATGAVVWPDFWNATVAPDFYALFDLQPSEGPSGSHESGQMLFDKQRAWRPLLAALLFNIQGRFYYQLASDWMGQGDKETFALAFYALRAPLHEVEIPVGSIGLVAPYAGDDDATTRCVPFREPRGAGAGAGGARGKPSCFVGNSMMQHVPGRQPGDPHAFLFVHTNLPKWSVKVPHTLAEYVRRWEALQEHNVGQGEELLPVRFLEAIAYLGDLAGGRGATGAAKGAAGGAAGARAGLRGGPAASAAAAAARFDPEAEAFEILNALREAPFFREYHSHRRAAHGEMVQPRMVFGSRFRHMEGFEFDWMRRPGAAAKVQTTRRNRFDESFKNYNVRRVAGGRLQIIGHILGYLETHALNYISEAFPGDVPSSVYHN